MTIVVQKLAVGGDGPGVMVKDSEVDAALTRRPILTLPACLVPSLLNWPGVLVFNNKNRSTMESSR